MSLSNKNLKSFKITDLENIYNIPQIANEYTQQPYNIGDYVNYQGVIYRCTTQISVAEAWNSSHWTSVMLADDLRDNYNDLKSAICGNVIFSHLYKNTSTDAVVWSTNIIDNTPGEFYIFVNNVINAKTEPAVRVRIRYTDDTFTYVDVNAIEWKYIKLDSNKTFRGLDFAFQRSDSALDVAIESVWNVTITGEDGGLVKLVKDSETIEEGLSNLELIIHQNGLYFLVFTNTIYFYRQGYRAKVFNRIGTDKVITAKSNLKVSVANGYKYSILKFSSTEESLETEISSTGWITNDYLINKGENFILNVAKLDDSNLSVGDSVNLLLNTYSCSFPTNNFVIGADLLKRHVSLSIVGQLSYLQSFCIYNGKYYSTNGVNIAEQDASFDVLRNTSIAIGHGNSLQLGSNGKAYASGWSDNKVYVVDLDTLTVESSITLPTTGYTTAAIDDINGIAYIFQRDTYPDTEEPYNYIVYDYVNESVILQKHTIPFAAMQSIDLYDDKLFVLNGLGNATNGYRVYDLNGNVLSEYVFGDISTEPEGVCIDRTYKELYISDVSKKIYKVEIV